MGYNALSKMQEKNRADYGIEGSPKIPELPTAPRNFGREALAFLRESCEDLKFDTSDTRRAALEDLDGRSSGQGTVPYNMERDLDRLSFEAAVGRFLESGSREDAFDIYYCYCEIFEPFGGGYESTGLLLEMLSEHETNASSLLMKHRDHYSHSVYVFLIGLAIYRNHAAVRAAYNRKYGLEEGPQAACHFLEYWGLTSLFHDIGYPFEIAHQQMKAYVCKLFKNNNDDFGFAPYVSYRNMDEFALSRLGDLNELYAYAITERLAESYLGRVGHEPYYLNHKLLGTLQDRAVHENPAEMNYLFMDHAYFSGLIVMKTYLDQHPEITDFEQLPEVLLDSFCAIILHNSLFKFTIRMLMRTREPLRIDDGQPLSYLLMLCDELQCWDRASYGKSSRGGTYPFDFDLAFEDGNMAWTYFFDKTYESDVLSAKAYHDVLTEGYKKRSGAVREGRSKFVDDIDEIISLSDVLPTFEPDVSKPDPSGAIRAVIEEKQKKTGLYLSDSNYLSLYDFALALNGRYCGVTNVDEMTRIFEENLSLEYKLSNIAQAKGFGPLLEKIGCFYTDRPVEYEPVVCFEDDELAAIAEAEHDRWCVEKLSLGWRYGKAHVGAGQGGADDKVMRERTRLHHDLVPFAELSHAETLKDSRPMEKMLELIRVFEGLTIYRM
ncbi:MAG: hypothetical protein IJI68_02365 [Eggerthellaceae bacterium]|nr:hypothetical protein [Eggerthellaceae bacterium]